MGKCAGGQKRKIKSKDCLKVDGIIPPPKGIQGMLKHKLTLEWQASIAKEISSLTEMGTITHLHSAAALLELGIDIDEMAPAHTHAWTPAPCKPPRRGGPHRTPTPCMPSSAPPNTMLHMLPFLRMTPYLW